MADKEHFSVQRIESDEQIALDLKNMDFDRLLSASAGTLAVVKLTPSLDTGKNIWGKYKYANLKDPKTGAVSHVVQQATLEGSEISGLYTSFDPFTQKLENATYRYQWVAPFNLYPVVTNVKDLEPSIWNDHDKRFVLGGTLVCRISDSVSGSGKFSNDHLIPPGWKQYVGDALKYHKNHPGIFSSVNSKNNHATLVNLLSSSNPFLSIDAARCLATNGLIDAKFVKSHLTSTDLYKQAAVTLLLYNSSLQSQPALMKEIGSVIHNSSNTEGFQGIALGAFVAHDNNLLATINQRTLDLHSCSLSNAYIRDILYLSGIRK